MLESTVNAKPARIMIIAPFLSDERPDLTDPTASGSPVSCCAVLLLSGPA
jgi:hypothetical protein